MPQPIPLLILSDAPSSQTGFGRITRLIAEGADANLKDVYRVATLGCGGPGSRKLNFFQYSMEGLTRDWQIPNLPEAWEDWAGKERGVILCIWDASRLGWFSRPLLNDWALPPSLKTFLMTAKIDRWIYAPLDAEGPAGRLSYPYGQSMAGFDRILAYGKFGEELIRLTLGPNQSKERDLDQIPHGIDSTVFYPRDRAAARANFVKITGSALLRGVPANAIRDEEFLIGTVATNQLRKDWSLWARVCQLFMYGHPKTRFWIHTDTLERSWSISGLLVDFGLLDRAMFSVGYLDDARMAEAYSACDLTLGIGLGEGFGLPIFESIFCGTPCIHGNYGGAAEHLSGDLLVNPHYFYDEGTYCCKRPIFDPKDWVTAMEKVLGTRTGPLPALDWSSSVWPRFEQWFRRGAALMG